MPKFLDALPLPRRRPLRISTDVPPLTGYSSVSPSPVDRSTTPSVTTSGPNTLQCLFHVLCMYDFQSSDPVHLPFHKDEVLTIIKQERSGWWAAMRPQGDRIGWIPSSFVLPLNKGKVLDYSDETLRLYESLNESPLSADHDPWVPVSNGDYKVPAFQLATPTDLVLYKGFFDERSSDVGDVRVPLTLESTSSRRIQGPHFPLLSEPGASQLPWPASPLLDAELYHHPYPHTVDDQAFLLATSLSSDDVSSEFMPSLDM